MASPTADATVTIADFAFDPSEIEVPAGTTVTWANTDQAPHTATGADGSFDTGTIAAGESGTHAFDTPGTYTYACAFHPNMQGTVTVT
jgi:plastocyanin